MQRTLADFALGPVVVMIMTMLSAGCRQAGHESGTSQESALSGELIIFHAGSLAVPLRAVSERFQQKYPGITVQAEAAGSRDTARKVSDLGRPCDVLASADYAVIEELLMPAHAAFNICFAGNEMALAFTSRSKFAGEISARNWPEVLLRPGVKIGRADPERDPCGYRTVMLLQLAEKYYGSPGLADKLLASDDRYLRPKGTDLLVLLESGEIDYVFIYRSVAEQHQLQMVLLPDEISLKLPAMASHYRTAMVKLRGRSPGQSVTQRGEAITYSVTIPCNAPHPLAAQAYVALLLSPEGQAILSACGQQPFSPARVHGFTALPKALQPYCRQEPPP